MLTLIIILIILAVAGVLGFVLKGLLWLGLIAVALFIITGIVAWMRGKSSAR